jgi:hypothetical protein
VRSATLASALLVSVQLPTLAQSQELVDRVRVCEDANRLVTNLSFATAVEDWQTEVEDRHAKPRLDLSRFEDSVNRMCPFQYDPNGRVILAQPANAAANEKVERGNGEVRSGAADLPSAAKALADASAPPEFKSAVFTCVGDHERCKQFYTKVSGTGDVTVTCGFSLLVCLTQQLIPFAGR